MDNIVADSVIPWINPIGGLGDTLMLSGVLKLVTENDPLRRFNLIRRTFYLSILKGHPAIVKIGYPPQDAIIIETDYWSKEEFETGKQRAFQILAHMFGLSIPVEERLFIPDELQDDQLLHNCIPWKKHNILIAPTSASPRKEIHSSIWENLVEKLCRNDCFVAQTGRLQDKYIRNAYSLLGLTTPRQLVAIMKRFDVVITVDNFIMHAAHMVRKPAIAIWGPTDHSIYGYPEQIHLQTVKTCDSDVKCIGPKYGELYDTPCPLGVNQCTNQIKPEDIYSIVQKGLQGGLAS